MKFLEKLKTKRLGRNKLLVICGSILIVGGISFLIKSNFGDRQNKTIEDYTIIAESGTLPGLVTASGKIQAIRSVNISPERQGLLNDLYVKEGDKVIKGQIIAKMKPGDYKYRFNEIKAEFEKDKNAYIRRKILFYEGAISAEQYDEYLNRFLKSEAKLKQKEVEGDQLSIRAPFHGLITSRYAEPGAFVAPTTRASTIAGSSSASIVELSQGLEVSAKVPESDIGRIQINQNADVRVDAFPDEIFKAKVKKIAPRASSTDNVTSFEVTLSVESPFSKLRIGMTADVEFQTGKSDISILVPTVSIVTKEGQPGVLIVGDKKQPKFQQVELGASSGSQTAILKGIKPNERIFIDLPPWAKQKRN